MTYFPSGWLDLESSMPQLISDKVAFIAIDDSSNVDQAVIVKSSNYNTCTGASWLTNPMSVNAEPQIIAVNSGTYINELMKADAMNQNTKMANIANSMVPTMQNLVYLYGNPNGQFLYQCNIDLDFGATAINDFQISVMENAATQGDEHGEIEVFKVTPTTNYTNVNTLNIFFAGYYGPLNIGIRLENTSNQSSMFNLKTIILPVPGVG